MVENIANDLGMRILKDLKKRYLNKNISFDNQKDKDEFYKAQIASDLAKSASTIRFLITVAPAESDGLSGRDLSIMANDLLIMMAKLNIFDTNKMETLFGLAEESNVLSFNELIDAASKVWLINSLL